MSNNYEQLNQRPTDPGSLKASDSNLNTVKTERSGSVLVVTIDRQRVRNAVDGPTAAALVQAFRAFDADPALSVAILTGAGNTFCSGFDLTAMPEQARGLRVAEDGDGPLGITRMLLSKPVIAAVEGYAVAGETIRLPRLIGHSHALDLILTGRGVSGEEAHMMGLANRLVSPGEALQAASALANDLARLPQLCLRSDRLSSYEQWSLTTEEALRNETRHGLEVIQSGEALTGARRFVEGRGRHGSTSDI